MHGMRVRVEKQHQEAAEPRDAWVHLQICKAHAKRIVVQKSPVQPPEKVDNPVNSVDI